MTRRCIFCSGSPLTKEHLWPRWGRRFATDPTFDRYAIRRDHSQRGTTTSTWGGPPFSKRAGVACAACNSGWMASLEAEVSEILDPERIATRPLTAGEQAALAVWATKTAIVFDAANPVDERLLDPSVAKLFYATRTPPEQAEIRLTAYGGELPHFADRRGLDLDNSFNPDRGWRQVAAVAWTIGPFAFLYASCTVPGVLGRIGMPEGPNYARLWPLGSRCRWRREPALVTDEDLIEFAELVPARLAALGRWRLPVEHTSAGSRH